MDAALYPERSNVPHQKSVYYKAFLDAANAPTVPSNPLNIYVKSIVRVSQGLFRITLAGNGRNLVSHRPAYNVNAAGVVRFAQPGPVSATAAGELTVDVLLVDASAAVQDPPAANANNFLSGETVLAATGTV